MKTTTMLALVAIGLLAIAGPVAADQGSPDPERESPPATIETAVDDIAYDITNQDAIKVAEPPTDFFIACKEWTSVDDDYCNLAVSMIVSACFHAFWFNPQILTLCLLLAVA